MLPKLDFVKEFTLPNTYIYSYGSEEKNVFGSFICEINATILCYDITEIDQDQVQMRKVCWEICLFSFISF